MAYTIVDLLAKLVSIEQNACNMYKNMAFMDTGSFPAFKTVANILAIEEERHVIVYKKLMDEAGSFSDIELDLSLYDKASELIQEFKKRIAIPVAIDNKSIIEFALEFEKKNLALLLDVRGRWVRKPEDAEGTVYMTLTDLIIEEEKHVKNLEPFCKK